MSESKQLKLFNIPRKEPDPPGDWVIDTNFSTDIIEKFEEIVTNVPCLKHIKSETFEHGVNVYKPGGTAKGHNAYYRFTYKEDGKVCHLHIRGGNICKVQAKRNARLVQNLLDIKAPRSAIIALIESF